MKRILVLLAIFAASLAAWWSIVYKAPRIAQSVLAASGMCPSADILVCKEVLSALGSTGDIFGAMTSLFSGLALFAVAFTLWSDTNARRESRKPLVLLSLDDDSVILRNPLLEPNLQLTLAVNANVVNKNGEAAFNIALDCSISSDNKVLKTHYLALAQPLASEGKEEVNLEIVLENDVLKAILGALTDEKKCVEFAFDAHYNSLENVKWSTRAVYELTCKVGDRRKRLNSLRSGTDDFNVLWANSAEVALGAQVRAGSWSHKRV